MNRTHTGQRYLEPPQSYSLSHAVRRQRAEAMAGLIGAITMRAVRHLHALSILVRMRQGMGVRRLAASARSAETKPA